MSVPRFPAASAARSSPDAPRAVRARAIIANSRTMRIRLICVRFPRASLTSAFPASSTPPLADNPRFIFAGTVATESQRQSRGVLEHWRDVNERGVNVTAPVVSADVRRAALRGGR